MPLRSIARLVTPLEMAFYTGEPTVIGSDRRPMECETKFDLKIDLHYESNAKATS